MIELLVLWLAGWYLMEVSSQAENPRVALLIFGVGVLLFLFAVLVSLTRLLFP